jgi:SAM-dependent methyltransferase
MRCVPGLVRSAVLCGALLATACSARGPDVIYLPSAADVVTRMLAVARVGPDDVVYDLGCGDGRIVIAAARDHGARGVCVDIDPSRIAESRRNADTAGVADRIEFRQADMFETDIGTATVVALYLSPSLNVRLRPKLLREVPPGARIVSHNFDMGDWDPDTVVRVTWPAGTTSAVQAWVLPADVAGTWELTVPGAAGERLIRVRFAQHFQEVTGTASTGGRTLALHDARLVGDSLQFQLTESSGNGDRVLRLVGRVSGGEIAGTVQAHAAPRDGGQSPADTADGAWRAVRP